MEFSDKQIEEFILLWEKTYGEQISPDEARKHARQLVQLVRAVYSHT